MYFLSFFVGFDRTGLAKDIAKSGGNLYNFIRSELFANGFES